MLDLCAMSWHWIVNATFWVVWGDQAVAMEDDQWGVNVCYEGRLVEGALEPTCEVECLWVMHLGEVEERFDTSPGLWRVFAGSGVLLLGLPKRPGDSFGWEKTLEGAM